MQPNFNQGMMNQGMMNQGMMNQMGMNNQMMNQNKMVSILVQNAKGVTAADLNGKSDPYCTVEVTTPNQFPNLKSMGKMKTKTVKNTLDPMWNQQFNLMVSNPNSQIILVIIYDADVLGSDDVIGYCAIPLKSVIMGQMPLAMKILGGKGFLNVTLQCNFGYPLQNLGMCQQQTISFAQQIGQTVITKMEAQKKKKKAQSKKKQKKVAKKIFKGIGKLLK